jgi:hypothetical protein
VRDLYACVETTPIGNGYSVDAPASLIWRHVDPPVHAIWDITYAPKMRIRTDYYACDERFEITGETGVIQVNRCTGRMLDEPVLTLYRDGEVSALHNLETDWGASFRLCTEHFVSVLREGQGNPLFDRDRRSPHPCLFTQIDRIISSGTTVVLLR